jgi:hypothetical protein
MKNGRFMNRPTDIDRKTPRQVGLFSGFLAGAFHSFMP